MDASPPPPEWLDLLLPADVRTPLPLLYATQEEADPMVRAKLFTPWTQWTWYVIEFDGDKTCGYFDLEEMAEVRGPAGLRIERDVHFTSARLSEVRAGLIPPPQPDGPT